MRKYMSDYIYSLHMDEHRSKCTSIYRKTSKYSVLLWTEQSTIISKISKNNLSKKSKLLLLMAVCIS